MKFYECDFENMEERIENNDNDHNIIDETISPAGSFVCDLLSIDFEGIARFINSLLNQHLKEKRRFPETVIWQYLDGKFFNARFDELNSLVQKADKTYELIANNQLIQKFKNVYGDLESVFLSDVYDYFVIELVLQAYLDESENTPEMCNPNNFENFIEGGLGKKISKGERAYSLSEYTLPLDIYIGCDIRGIVSNVFSSLSPYTQNYFCESISSLTEFLITAIYYFFSNGFIFKRCKNCNCFFVPLSRSDELYCNRKSPQDETKTCKEYGSKKLWYDRLKNDEVAKLARNIYSAKQMLVRRNPDIPGYKQMFEYFKSERKKWEAQVKAGEKTQEEYVHWLNEIKTKKTL